MRPASLLNTWSFSDWSTMMLDTFSRFTEPGSGGWLTYLSPLTHFWEYSCFELTFQGCFEQHLRLQVKWLDPVVFGRVFHSCREHHWMQSQTLLPKAFTLLVFLFCIPPYKQHYIRNLNVLLCACACKMSSPQCIQKLNTNSYLNYLVGIDNNSSKILWCHQVDCRVQGLTCVNSGHINVAVR